MGQHVQQGGIQALESKKLGPKHPHFIPKKIELKIVRLKQKHPS
ncbi:hypothetical protein [Candidatus Nitrosotalea okcheonensis]|uniref:Uncharacterized protein n=1 Tax=Candidatus Nitrosotalea okcheonensis TaxID=1903276 RepID=A0A2H1FEF9_9ARCH|nr:hypothetical protein [Candidatus Nitrosotalea okcheonensis]SMH71144.1 protein of unknown function [Candidatus Nitrosotalea okcheonensis]